MGRLVELCQFYDTQDAQIARAFLASSGMPVLLLGEQHLSVDPNLCLALGGYRLIVPEGEADVARQALAENLAAHELNAAATCRECGVRSLSRKQNWLCTVFWLYVVLVWSVSPVAFSPCTRWRRLKCVNCGTVRPALED